MKLIRELQMGYSDAENYRRRKNKDFFNKIFLSDDIVNEICDEGKYFLIGEKGTGKTAYSVYLSNHDYVDTLSVTRFVRETDYQKFISLKSSNNLMLSDYTSIWETILLLLISQLLREKKCIKPGVGNIQFYNKINDILKQYESAKVSPEILTSFEIIENKEVATKALAQIIEAGAIAKQQVRQTETKFQTVISRLKQSLKTAIESIRLNHSFILFIDGIDIRPNCVSQTDYIDCIKGLTHAIWALNNDFFANLKGNEKYLVKVVLLIRPDIFPQMGLQNINNKIRDNSILLDWKTTFSTYTSSRLYKLANKLLASQQDQIIDANINIWDYYFPYKVKNSKTKQDTDSAFIEFLRFSYYRPRDIIILLSLYQKQAIAENSEAKVFDKKLMSQVIRDYSNFLLGELKDQLIFYYSDEEYELFLKFFQYLEGRYEFDYDYYLKAYNKTLDFINNNGQAKPRFFETADVFLQFLYELNVLYYMDITDGEEFFHWCFKERTYANLNPKVKTHSKYLIHMGIARALNIGKTLV